MNFPLMTQNRKRSRNLYEDDTSDFMPLSKRINNLHINNAFCVSSGPMNMFLKPVEWGPGPPICYAEPEIKPETPDPVPEWHGNIPQYNPELDESQNPYYFSNNKLLFDLFVERMQRNGHNFQ